MTRLSHTATTTPLLLLTLTLAGCGGTVVDPGNPTLYPVTGKVLLPGGGPLTAGRIVFIPVDGGYLPTGTIGAGGKFTLSTGEGKEGAPAGNYKVRIEPDASTLKVKGGVADLKSLPFPAKYMDADGDTGLTATVKDGPTDLEPFKLSNAPAGVGGGRGARDKD